MGKDLDQICCSPTITSGRFSTPAFVHSVQEVDDQHQNGQQQGQIDETEPLPKLLLFPEVITHFPLPKPTDPAMQTKKKPGMSIDYFARLVRHSVFFRPVLAPSNLKPVFLAVLKLS